MQSQDNPLIERTLKNLAAGMSAVILSLGLLVVFNRFAPSAIGSPLWLLHSVSILVSVFSLALVLRQVFRNKRLLASDTSVLSDRAINAGYKLRVVQLHTMFFMAIAQISGLTNATLISSILVATITFILLGLAVLSLIHMFMLSSIVHSYGIDPKKLKQASLFSAFSLYSGIYMLSIVIFGYVTLFLTASWRTWVVGDTIFSVILVLLGFGCAMLELRRILKANNNKQETLAVVGQVKVS